MKKIQTIQEQLSSSETQVMVLEWLEENKDLGRQELARYLCERLDVRDRRGKLRLAGMHKALRVLESRGYWQLPAGREVARGWQPRRLEQPVAPAEGVPSRVEALKDLYLVEVSSREDELFRIWNELMLSEHPLQDCRLVGRQLRYLIGSNHGWLGGIGFGSCALRLKVRDQWLGWDEPTRKEYQERLINLTRFLIRPQVRCENLASRVLSLCLDRVSDDFADRYGFEPWWVESFVDCESYSGGCFRAANWRHLGTSQGRGRSAPNRQVTSRKDIYLYELKRGWRARMGLPSTQSQVKPVRIEEALESRNWVEAEFAGVDFGHQVTEQRLLHIVRSKAQNPGASYTECYGGDRHQLKAHYRFMGNKREEISPQGILRGHRAQTLGRIKDRKRALVVQDTTVLDFSERLHCNGLGVIGTNQTTATSTGLKMHSSMVLSEQGLPLGVWATEIWAPEVGGRKAANRSIQEKESYRWLHTLEELAETCDAVAPTELICIGDRESDIFELFDYRRRRARKVHLLVRANYNRCLEDHPKLFDHLADLPVQATAHIKVPRQRGRKSKPSRPGRVSLPARKARVQLKWKKLRVLAPNAAPTRHLPPVELYAVEIREPRSPKGAAGLHWVLLTTVPVVSRKQALRCLRWYTRRWRIEEWHRVLKSGCRIESHQHQEVSRLARAIAIDAVIAWRVMLLTLLGREVPEMPCEFIFSPWECQLLEILQPHLAPETIRGPKKGAYRSVPPPSSSPDSAEPYAATPQSHPAPKP